MLSRNKQEIAGSYAFRTADGTLSYASVLEVFMMEGAVFLQKMEDFKDHFSIKLGGYLILKSNLHRIFMSNSKYLLEGNYLRERRSGKYMYKDVHCNITYKIRSNLNLDAHR